MQRFKKPFIWLTLLSLIITLFPVGLVSTVKAAGTGLSSTTYFSPDILDIRKTISLVTEYTAADHVTSPAVVDPKDWTQINRENVYKISKPNLTIEGTFAQVSSTNMTVKVEKLNSVANSSGQVSYIPDTTSYNYGVISLDPTDSSGKRFIAKDLSLFSGYNKVTFTGLQGGLQRSESFYVLYDKIPYLSELKIVGGGTSGVALNEGTPVVVKDSVVSLQGVAVNATKVNISANGGASLESSIDSYSGTFYTPGLTLTPGLNTLNLVIQNGSDSFNVQRTVFYYKQSDPLTALYVYDGVQGYSIKGATPSVTTNPLTSVTVIGQILIPYSTSTASFKDTAQIYLNNPGAATPSTTPSAFTILPLDPFQADGTLSTAPGEEVIIPDSNGQPEYRLATFKITAGLSVYSGNVLQPVNLNIKYGSGSGALNHTASERYKYLPGQSLITGLYYLPSYKAGDVITTLSKEPLNGAQVNTGKFSILVESTKAPATAGLLKGDFLPTGTKVLNMTYKAGTAITGSVAKYAEVYEISGFPNGQQQLRFNYGEDYRDVTVSYVNMNNIYVDNLTDGQTYTFDSKKTNNLNITGKFIGFEKIDTAQYFVNGLDGSTLQQGALLDGTDTTFGVTTAAPTFSLDLNIKPSGPLVYGENLIRFVGRYKDSLGNIVERVKELRIYIVDLNGSTIEKFIPSLAVSDRPDLPTLGMFNTISFSVPAAPTNIEKETFNTTISKLLTLSPRFTYDNTMGNYSTTQEDYDLVVRGGGASWVNLYIGSERMVSQELTKDVATSYTGSSFAINGKSYSYEIIGSEKDFVMRVRNLHFDVPGSHIYNLELVNSTGARTTKKLEVTRVVEAYRLLSPKPTVGTKYVVNKNFVRFDIEAEGATKVLIGKDQATPLQLDGKKDRFVYDYVGLKPDKSTSIKIQIVRANTTFNDTIDVFYTSTITLNTQYMAEKVASKYSVFNKSVELSFPKGTVLETANPGLNVTQFYPDNKILFGIADPKDGVVERRDDYGNYVGLPPANDESILDPIALDANLTARFNSFATTSNFSLISDVYWISGGLGEYRNGNTYYPASNGLAPQSVQGDFPDYNGGRTVKDVPSGQRKIVPSHRGSLTLTFDKNVVDEVGTTVTVFRYTGTATQGTWENIGGEVDMKKHTVTVPFDDFGYFKVMKLRRGYNDITNHNWARNILNALYSKGIMASLRADAFGADDQTTRGEFATLLVKGLNLPLNFNKNEQTFFDIVYGAQSATWSFEYIETAARAGIVTGRSEGFFDPGMPITREQAAVMIARALKLKLGTNDEKLNASLAKAFLDSGSMDVYSRPAILAVSGAKIMSGIASVLPGQKKPVYNFNPKGYLNRAEAGKIAVELLKKSTNIFPKNLS